MYIQQLLNLKTEKWQGAGLSNWCYPEDLESQKDLRDRYVPVFGQTVSCGLFGISDDYIEKYQSLDTRFIKNKASTYFFVAAGDSMSPLIMEKDILIVDRSIEPSHNRIVVVSVNGEMFCKRLIKRNSSLILKSDNSIYEPIPINGEMDIIFFGVVTGLGRDLYQ